MTEIASETVDQQVAATEQSDMWAPGSQLKFNSLSRPCPVQISERCTDVGANGACARDG